MVTSFDPQFPNTPSVQPVHVEDQPVAVTTSTQSGVAAPAAGNLAATAANTDYSFNWSAGAVRHVLLQNNTAASLGYDIDTAATPGSPQLAAGQTVFLDITMTTLHLLTAAIENVNGTAAANIVVRAWQ